MDGMIRFHLSGTENMLTYIQFTFTVKIQKSNIIVKYTELDNFIRNVVKIIQTILRKKNEINAKI